MAKKFKSFGSVVAFRVILSMAIVMIATFFVTNYIFTGVINRNYENLLKISMEGIEWDMDVFKGLMIREAKSFLESRISPSFVDYIVEDGKVVYNSTKLPDDYIEKMVSIGSSGDLGGVPFWNVTEASVTAGVIMDDSILKRFVRNIRGNGFLVAKVGKVYVMPQFLRDTEIEDVVRRGGRGYEIFVNDQRYFFRSFSKDGMVFYAFLSASVFDDIKASLINILLISFLVGIVVISYISHLIARYLSSNLRKILEGFEKLREGNFEFLEIKSHDELGMIMGEFNVTVAVLRDAMEKMKIAKEMAEEASRTKSMFLASVSHEIRNPLNSILGFTELLLKEEKDPKKREYLMTIYKSGEHLLNVINDILDLSKIESGKMELSYEVYNPKKLVEEVVQMYQPMASKKKIKIFAEIDKNVPEEAIADAFRVRQILINLVSNAVKFTDTGYVKVKLTREGDDLVYVVEDTGIGIPKEKIEKIFEPFTQADAGVSKKYGGTGLGLSISKKLANMMKGDLWLESELGRGTKAYLRIPIKVVSEEELAKGRKIRNERLALISVKAETVKNPLVSFLKGLGFEVKEYENLEELRRSVEYIEPRVSIVEVSKTADVGGKLREHPTIAFLPEGSSKIRLKNVLFVPLDEDISDILGDITEFLEISMKEKLKVAVVDDNDVNRTLISKMLDRILKEHELGEYEDGEDIVKAYGEGETFDLVLMDVQMPKMDGFTATKNLREMGFEGKVILATGSTGESNIRKAEEAGCDDILPKPIKLEDLREKIWKYFPKAIASEKTEQEKMVVVDSDGELNASELFSKSLEKLEKEMGMEREVAVGMIEDYMKFLKRKLQILEKAIGEGNETEIRKVAHDLTGSGEMYGFDEVTEVGRRISEAAKKGDFDQIKLLAEKLKSLINAVENEIKNSQVS